MLDLKLFLQSHNETLSALYKMTALKINFTLVNGLYQGKQLNIFLILDLGFNLHKWTEFHHHLRGSYHGAARGLVTGLNPMKVNHFRNDNNMLHFAGGLTGVIS